MKKVRFESPRQVLNSMDELECHFPRPFIETPSPRSPSENLESVLLYSSDPVQRYECSNSLPYPILDKIKVPEVNTCQPEWHPSNDLELSMLDGSSYKPRELVATKPTAFNCFEENVRKENPRVLTEVQNKPVIPPNVLTKDEGFFLRRDNIDKYQFGTKPLQNQMSRLTLGKENDPIAKKAEIINMAKRITPEKIACPQSPTAISCQCYHCLRVKQNHAPMHQNYAPTEQVSCCSNEKLILPTAFNHCLCSPKHFCFPHCNGHTQTPRCNCERPSKSKSSSPESSVDKKTWAIERYEQGIKCDSKDLEKPSTVSKEKREPTVADLFKIIKLQNEQLQLLQEKVDKFISCTEAKNKSQNMAEQLALQSETHKTPEQHKISIGVMTSFEMVRTATVINQEIVKQTNENSQIQCNRSHISIKEVVSTTKPVNLNFLDGIPPVDKTLPSQNQERAEDKEPNMNEDNNDDKTYNEQSLYNLQVENATTPLISPDQSMFLDVKDYSDSDESVTDRSNVGWTYYNKVMTHVNGLLHDSDMPSSANAMYKNTRQQCMQMQVDKTNLSVIKRVKFGDDLQGVHQPHIYAAMTDIGVHQPQVYSAPTDIGTHQPQIYAGATDISWKMNQLAAKYLKPVQHQVSTPMNKGSNMSIATKNYFERHHLLTDTQTKSPVGELPNFLDITALKQQPKLL